MSSPTGAMSGMAAVSNNQQTMDPPARRRRRQWLNIPLLTFLVPLAASCFRLGMLMMSPAETSLPAQRQLKPKQEQTNSVFLHGIASGDPTSDSVILWTRVSVDSTEASVSWKISKDNSFTTNQATGSATTDATHDYTIHIDVTGLDPNTFYYYQFQYCDPSTFTCEVSATGRTKTAPAETAQVNQVRFASVSCSSYQKGYFHAYDRLVERDDVDVVVHLGDYIYEGASFEVDPDAYGDVRPFDPPNECITLEDYRRRHAQTRSDPSLQNIHQFFPFIAMWDDHGFANNAGADGAEAHDPATEGPWQERKKAAMQAYFEWLPLREVRRNAVSMSREEEEEKRSGSNNPLDFTIYRKFSYGQLVDVFVLDTRILRGETQGELGGYGTQFLPRYYGDHKLLGDAQMAWIKDNLSNSQAKWKVIAQQAAIIPISVEGLFTHDSDQWDGFHPDRAELMGHIADNHIDNVVVLAADRHATIMADIPKERTADIVTYKDWLKSWPFEWKKKKYTSLAVQFLVNAVSSTGLLEDIFGTNPVVQKVATLLIQGPLSWMNPYGKYIEVRSNGYQILDFQEHRAQADIYFTGSPANEVDTVPLAEQYQRSYYTSDGDNFVQETFEESSRL